MIDLAAWVAKDLARPAVLVLDAYYSNSTAFIRASQYNELFVTAKNKFKKTEVMLYGKKSKVSYYSVELIWRPIKSNIRFVLVEYQGSKIILMSSNLEFDPLTIIQLYGHRFKIEVTIKGLKYCIGAFDYHFWSKAMPQFSKKKSVNLEKVVYPRMKENIIKTVQAIEGHANIGCITFEILQPIALNYPKEIWCKYAGWLRTKTSDIPSEEIVFSVLGRDFLLNLFDYGSSCIFKILLAKRREQRYLYYDKAA